MAPKDKMRFHFCNQKKEIMNLKNEKKKKIPCPLSFLRITSRPF